MRPGVVIDDPANRDEPRRPELMPPTAVTIAVKKALHLPVMAIARYPVSRGRWVYKMMRIA